MATIQFKRGTQAQLDAAAGNNELQVGEPYWIDGEKLAVGTSASTYEYVDSHELLMGGAGANFASSPQLDGKTMFSGLKGIAVVASLPGSPDPDILYFVED